MTRSRWLSLLILCTGFLLIVVDMTIVNVALPSIGRDLRFIGGDTQLLGNFEYRVPIFGPVSLAAFADIGSAFNLSTKSDQTFSTQFLADQPFACSLGGLTELVVRRNPQLAIAPTSNFTCSTVSTASILRGLLVQGDRLLTKEEFADLQRVGPTDPVTNLPFGVQPIYLRGGNSTDDLVCLILMRDGKPMRYFPLGSKSSVHVSLAVVEDIFPDSLLEILVAAPKGVAGTVIIDFGLYELD